MREALRAKTLIDALELGGAVAFPADEGRGSRAGQYRLALASTPLTWPEVEAAAAERDPEQLAFSPGDVLERLERRGDLFAPVCELEEELP